MAVNMNSIRKLFVSINPTNVRFLSRSAALGSSYVDRMRMQEKIKTDDSVCKAALARGQFVPYYKGKPVLLSDNRSINWLNFSTAESLNPDLENQFVFLNCDEKNSDFTPRFAFPVSESDENIKIPDDSFAADMRFALFAVKDQDGARLLGQGWSMLQWQRKNKFCANCGEKVHRSYTGTSINCSSCSNVVYPSLSPVGIVLVSDALDEKVLLIRQPRYPPGMYSCIAGFVDGGESLDQCIRREVAEEAGIDIDPTSVRVHGSQHWPMPVGSLMIGCHARASDPEQTLDPCTTELEDARWMDQEQLRKALENVLKNPKLRTKADNTPDNIFVPPKEAIAHHLISDWLKRKGAL